MELVRLQREDLPQLLSLLQELNPSDPELEEDRAEALWNAIGADGKVHLFGLKDARELIAHCHLVIIPNFTRGGSPYGLIENVIVKENRRGAGLGTQLLREVLDFARDACCYKVILTSGRSEPRVKDFYEKAGFSTGRTAYHVKF
jgi:GNAT superfamily N-acetyltransferase